MSIEDFLLMKSEHNRYDIYMQIIGILNAYDVIIFVRSQELVLDFLVFSCGNMIVHQML